jgi:imidazole glycerol-phosphate synthase subunit HisF
MEIEKLCMEFKRMKNQNIRLISRLDIKGKNLIKGIQLEGFRVIGCPSDFAEKYYNQGADELIYMDAVASLYGRNHLAKIIQEAAKNIFIPLTVGGGIRSVDDATQIFRAGADKIALNTAAVANPNLISELAMKFGSQAVVLSVEAKKITNSNWEVYTDGGRVPTGLDVVEWIDKAISYGAGEVLLTSVDREGTRKGFDISLYSEVNKISNIPIIASGGMGNLEDLSEVLFNGKVDAVAMADALHYNRESIGKIRDYSKNLGFKVRDFDG